MGRPGPWPECNRRMRRPGRVDDGYVLAVTCNRSVGPGSTPTQGVDDACSTAVTDARRRIFSLRLAFYHLLDYMKCLTAKKAASEKVSESFRRKRAQRVMVNSEVTSPAWPSANRKHKRATRARHAVFRLSKPSCSPIISFASRTRPTRPCVCYVLCACTFRV